MYVKECEQLLKEQLVRYVILAARVPVGDFPVCRRRSPVRGVNVRRELRTV